MRRIGGSFLLVLGLCFTACGDDDDGDGGGGTPVEQCDSLVERGCQRLAACLVDSGEITEEDRADAEEQCAPLLRDEFDCANAESGPDYPACRAAIEELSCADLAAEELEKPVACAGIGDDTGAEDPVEQCNALVDAACTRVAECGVEGGLAEDLDAAYDECVGAIRETLDCTLAVEVGLTYEQCLDDIEAVPCSIVNDPEEEEPLPATCDGVISVSG